ncbi:hypothetical protein Verru16b_00697 [Lacunisphaera limnophila]|uniref:Tricorn protease homolog n=1 Tax=Lacunisphaera limnophila TaxID=1838286 RepID=A0A1D8ARW8_9BACT|nr:S41 family peptidase [Lacunisphaera limnophila]AOS43645.1 hypothetical protein Verru16b_00697 [Lacunisphaera limnophila]
MRPPLPGTARRLRRFAFTAWLSACTLAIAGATTEPLWLRYPAVSPDGTTIAFSYAGRLWRVAATGGEASPLTDAGDYATHPVWSPDGTQLAVALKRRGNTDVHLLPAAGGESRRLTHHAAADLPAAFSPDGATIYFASPRLGTPHSVLAGTAAHTDQLYAVPATGGRNRLVLPTPALNVSVDATGGRFLYESRPIYENEWRKGAVSDGTHDVWLFDRATATHRRLTSFRGEDREPVWDPASIGYYYLSERNRATNLWHAGLEPGATPTEVTHHTGGTVRFPSVARDGSLVYGHEGEVWRLAAGATEPTRVAITLPAGVITSQPAPVDAGKYLSEITASADGRRVALVARGEVFVLATDTGRLTRITRTAGHEQHVRFSPDGTTLYYASERDGDMDLFAADLGQSDEIKPVERKLVDTTGDLLYPRPSPDGRSLAYLADRSTLRVRDLATGATVDAMPAGGLYSYVDEDVTFTWSPDSRFLAASGGSIVANQDIVLLDATGRSAPRDVTRSGFPDSDPQFSSDGQSVFWVSERAGLRQADAHGGQGDVFRAYLTREAFDATRHAAPAAPPVAGWQPQLAGIERRTQRITPASSLLVFHAPASGDEVLFTIETDMAGRITGRTVAREGGKLREVFTRPAPADGYAVDAGSRHVYLLGDGRVDRIELATGETKAFALDLSLEVDSRAELTAWFERFWRLTKFKFYEPTLHGRDWDALRRHYARFLPHVDAWEDFAEMMSELAGELNASHMGCYYLKEDPAADKTASLGLYFDDTYTGAGARVTAILPGGPADLAANPCPPGTLLLAINDQPITAETDLEALLNGLVDQPVRLRLQTAVGAPETEATIVAIAQNAAQDLAYDRWIDERRAMVDRLSGGRLGYVHISAMDLPNYQQVYSDVVGDLGRKEALIVDIRYNKGGNIHDELVALFTGRDIASFTTRAGENIARIPTARWTKPTALLQNAAAYSDGSIFPHLYQRLQLGPLVGDRVPGTGTAVWWMYVMNGSLKWGVPQLGAKDNLSGWFENDEIVPDVLVTNDPAALAAGRDPQLEATVAALLQKLPQP